MTNPANSFQTNFGRFYAHPSVADDTESLRVAMGKMSYREGPYDPKPSVTNIIGMMHQSFLAPYTAKLVAEYAVEHLDNLQYQAEKFGPEVAKGILKGIPSQQNKNAVIGDEIHAAIDLWCQGADRDKVLYDIGASSTAAAMYAQWLHFTEVFPMEVVRSEFTCWSYEWGYAGTGDLMWRLDEPVTSPQGITVPAGLWLVDTKSGNNVYPEVALQTTALAHADVILSPDGREFPMPAIDVQGVMHIRPRSVKLHQLERTETAFETFLACKRLFDWKRFDAPLVLQDPYKTEKPKGDN